MSSHNLKLVDEAKCTMEKTSISFKRPSSYLRTLNYLLQSSEEDHILMETLKLKKANTTK